MAYVIGIDTGGTYTDAVLLETKVSGSRGVLKKAKAFTTRSELALCIKSSIKKLDLSAEELKNIEKVVLSTTLATNAIVEDDLHRVGLILIGQKPQGELATEYIRTINGAVNIKGRILSNINEDEAKAAIEELYPKVESIAISGGSSIRNPILEQEVRRLIKTMYDIPAVCGHELANDLGFWERTNTAIINAGLLPIINQFTEAIRTVLKQLNINAPAFVVKGDGTIAKLSAIKSKPIDTVLSGPAASMIGAINLTQIEDTIVSDMGGTTTDIGIVQNKRIKLSEDGATIGSWKLRIKSAKLRTFGLGGDSQIRTENGRILIGPKRVLPACRGGGQTITPTDILHYTGEFDNWDRAMSERSIKQQAEEEGISANEYVNKVIEATSRNIYEGTVTQYNGFQFPVCAIGAPAKSWYYKTKDTYDFELVIPKHYEVAGAVGAGTAGAEATAEAIVRPGEEGFGFLVHTELGRFACTNKKQAIHKAIEVSRSCSINIITSQNLELAEVTVSCQDIYSDGNRLIYQEVKSGEPLKTDELDGYVETRIKVSARGKLFA